MFINQARRMLSVCANRSNDGPVVQMITTRIKERFADLTHFAIFNDSYKHAGHRDLTEVSNKTESHLRLEIASDEFKGLPLVSRHRLVYSLLDEVINEYGIHAIQLTTRTISEQTKKNSN